MGARGFIRIDYQEDSEVDIGKSWFILTNSFGGTNMLLGQ